MTTIVFRDGVMAADSRAYSGDSTPIGFKRKVHKFEDGTLVGVSSTQPGMAESFVNWLRDPMMSDLSESRAELNFQALVVNPKGEVFYYLDDLTASGPLVDSFFAIGSGDRYAVGALSCGATAEVALLVAAQHDVWTDGKIMQVKSDADAYAAFTENEAT